MGRSSIPLPYDKRVKKSPYNGSRNLVWTSKEFQASEGNRPRKNDAYRSTNSPVSSTGYHVSNQPRKNDAYRSINSPVSGTEIVCQTSQVKMLCMGQGARLFQAPEFGGWEIIAVPSLGNVYASWKAGNCKKGEQCEFLHSWCCFPGLVMVATLEGHKKDIKGIALPQGSDKLYSASGDGALRTWDCHTGQCVHEINLQAEAGSLISEGPWDFLGLPNAVKAFNVQTCKDLHLTGSVGGQVSAMAFGNGMLFAGTSSVHALCGLHDAEARPIIFCFYQNGTVGIYDLPTFEERGMMFSTYTIGTLKIGPEGLLFSGDEWESACVELRWQQSVEINLRSTQLFFDLVD